MGVQLLPVGLEEILARSLAAVPGQLEQARLVTPAATSVRVRHPPSVASGRRPGQMQHAFADEVARTGDTVTSIAGRLVGAAAWQF
ncbi:MAG TPA: hypothetical protein VGM79_13840 [Streptosporangiaceae bacterium]